MQRAELIGIIDVVEIGSAGEMIPAKPAQIAISQDGVQGDKHLRSAACCRRAVGSCILTRFRTNRQGHMVSTGFRRLCARLEPIRYRRQPTRIMRTGVGGFHAGYLAHRCLNQAERFRRILNDGLSGRNKRRRRLNWQAIYIHRAQSKPRQSNRGSFR